MTEYVSKQRSDAAPCEACLAQLTGGRLDYPHFDLVHQVSVRAIESLFRDGCTSSYWCARCGSILLQSTHRSRAGWYKLDHRSDRFNPPTPTSLGEIRSPGSNGVVALVKPSAS